MERLRKEEITFILLTCCSCKRPEMLKKALLSVNTLKIPDNIKTEVLVVDNDENESAKSVVQELRSSLKLKVNYVTEKKRGLAFARNKSLETALQLGASHLVMFDDDEFFDENCLIEQIKMYKGNPDAYIISGPVPSVFDDKVPSYITKNIVFKQPSSKKTGEIKSYCASGNVFMPITPIKENNLRFSEEFVFTGGEDGDFFGKASTAGYTIVWSNEAIIYETVPDARANVGYILKKSYYNGYAGAFSRFKKRNKTVKKYVYVFKNAVVCAIDGILTPFSILFGPVAFLNMTAMTVRSAGKVTGALKCAPSEFYKKVYGE